MAFPPNKAPKQLHEICVFFELSKFQKILNVVKRDPDDNAVLECAIEGKANFIVSGDKDLLDLKAFRGIENIRAGRFLEILAGKKK